MAVYYSAKTLSVIDEQYTLTSKTAQIVNNGMTLDFNGNGSVSIQTVQTVNEVDYVASGTDRFGALTELGNGLQTFTMSQDKAFTFSIDRRSADDSMNAMDMKKAVARQVRVVNVPNTDKYTLATAEAYAVANTQHTADSGTALTTSNAYQYLLETTAYLIDQLVENENIFIYMTQTTLNLLKRDTTFKVASDSSYNDSKTGKILQIDGMTIKVVPTSYLPANTGYLALADNVLARPVKTDMQRVLDNQRGIDGLVAEGRRRYDVFIATNAGKAIVVHMNA